MPPLFVGPNVSGSILTAASTIAQPTWFISNAGSNSNDGLSSATPIPEPERQRRWGLLSRLAQSTTVTYLDSPGATVPVNCNVQIPRGASLLFQGTRTITKTGTFQAVTTLNRGTQTPWSVTDAVGALGAADVGRILRVPSGPRAGNYCRVMKDNGANSVRISPLGNIAISFIPFTQATPTVGDPYEVDTLPTLQIGTMSFSQQFNDFASAPLANAVQFDSLTLDGSTNLTGIIVPTGISVFYSQCVQLHLGLCGPGFHFVGGGGSDGSFCFGAGALVTMMSTGYLHNLAGFQVFQGASLTIDGDALFQNCELPIDATVFGGNVSFFDGSIADQRGVIVQSDGVYISKPFGSTDLLWGTNNAGHGVVAKSASKMVYTTKPTINVGLGAGREALIGGTDTLWANVPFANANTAVIAALA